MQRAGLVADPAPCEVGPKLTRIVAAAGDRLKVAGDILAYADFFFADEHRLRRAGGRKDARASPAHGACWRNSRTALATVEPFEVGPLEAALQEFVAEEGIKIGDVIHALARRGHRQSRRPGTLRLPGDPRPGTVHQENRADVGDVWHLRPDR